jgi:8-oxo-dGTP diphosphatase
VVRNGARTLVAIVQRSKDDRWVLPRGKLKRTESPIVGARREVVEETGHRVRVREFLGAITYRARGRPKVVQFWRMQAQARPSYDLMKDIAAVEWLPLPAAIRRLSYPLEKLFLRNVARRVIRRRKRATRRRPRGARNSKSKSGRRAKRKSGAGKKASAKTRAAKTRIAKTRASKPRAAKSRGAKSRATPSGRGMLQRVLRRLGG